MNNLFALMIGLYVLTFVMLNLSVLNKMHALQYKGASIEVPYSMQVAEAHHEHAH